MLQEAAAAATVAQENPYGIVAMLEEGDVVTLTTFTILAIMSLASWYIIFTKVWDQRNLRKAALAAEGKFWTAGSIKDAIERLPKGDTFRLLAEDGVRAASHHEGRLTDRIDMHEWITMSLQRSSDNVTSGLNSGLAFLASVGSTAPFVGLFGTVWGILQALIKIGVAGQASIDKVAGPVGEALIMTAIGLVVAVPAVMGYNWLIGRNKAILDKVRSFTSDLHAYLVSGARVATAAAPAAAAPAVKK
jgi:biopolymer transport protein ExbB